MEEGSSSRSPPPFIAISSTSDFNNHLGSQTDMNRKMELLEQRMSRGLSGGTLSIDNNNSHKSEDLSSGEPEANSDSDELVFIPPGNGGADKVKKKRKHYTPVEDTKILEGVKKYGSDWDEIVKWGHLERTASQIKERYRRLSKKDDQTRPAKYRKISDEVAQRDDDPNKKTDLDSKVNQIERMRKELEDEKEKLKLKEHALAEKEEALQKWEQQLQEQTRAVPTKADKTLALRKSLQELLIKDAIQEKELARSKSLQQCQRLGKVTFERHGTSYVEIWQDGQAFKDVAQKINTLNEQKEIAEKMRKEVAKRIKKKGLAESTTENMLELEDLLQQEEIYKLKQGTYKREEMEVNTEREKLLIEKNRHIRELKRINDEDQSRFNCHPILKDRYALLTLLGKGGFSEVYKAFDLQEVCIVACKIHQLNTVWTDKKKENYIRHVCREYAIHKSVVHPKIVQLFDVFEIDDNSFCTVLEYCDGQDLDLYLKTQQYLTEREAKSIITQIFAGLAYLNGLKRPIIHYDLKPGNILFSNGEVKITDFGLSKVMEENQDAVELTSQGAGTYWYLPPECFEVGKEPPKISSKVDVWSAGVIFYQMLFGKKPFGNNLSQQKILADNIIQNSVLEFPSKPAVSKEAKDFIRKCLSHSQHGRPDVKACYNDSYLKLSVQKKEKKEAKPAPTPPQPPQPLPTQTSQFSLQLGL